VAVSTDGVTHVRAVSIIRVRVANEGRRMVTAEDEGESAGPFNVVEHVHSC
jgi:hypothetical protein